MDHTTLIRQLIPADRDAFFQLRLRALLAHPEAFGQSHQEALEKGPQQYDAVLHGARAAEGHFLLGAFMAVSAADRPVLIGMVGLKREDRLKERHKALMIGMYVAPEAGGRGVGRALLDELLTRAARIDGLRQIHLAVTAQNHAARRLYEGAGFIHYGTEPAGLCVGGVLHDTTLMTRLI